MSAFPWPLVDDIKTALKLNPTDPTFDGEIQGWIAASESFIQTMCGVPIASTTYTDIDRTTDDQPTATFAPPTTLFINRRPIDLSHVITVNAYDGTLVDTVGPNPAGPPYYSSTQMFMVDPIRALLYAVVPGDITFGNGPYAITYNAGLSAHPEWATKYRALASLVVRDFCRWLNDAPDAGVKSVGAGGGVTMSFDCNDVPMRLRKTARLLPGGGPKLGLAG